MNKAWPIKLLLLCSCLPYLRNNIERFFTPSSNNCKLVLTGTQSTVSHNISSRENLIFLVSQAVSPLQVFRITFFLCFSSLYARYMPLDHPVIKRRTWNMKLFVTQFTPFFFFFLSCRLPIICGGWEINFPSNRKVVSLILDEVIGLFQLI
jgi:hypothetical protein